METAYERSLDKELHNLDTHFTSWKAGQINAFELTDLIHNFHQGPARKLFNTFTTRGMNEIMVAGFMTQGIINESDVSSELLDFLAPYIEFINRD
ncbi:MAG TPA: hypothetical protein VGL56_04010 [Fimbriimonadaceae bacterium]|jgi:hypothetical protein